MGPFGLCRYCGRLVFRWLKDWLMPFVLDMISGNHKPVPPIRNPLLLRPAWKLAEQIRKQEIKSIDAVEAYISRIKEVQPYINAVVDERYDEALDEARKADERISSGHESVEELESSAPFLGVPFTAKEIIPIKGLSFTLGLVLFTGHKAEEDADVVKLMKAARAIAVAVTNVPEYSMWCETANHIYGITYNPYDTTRTCGGSSGGEGALIAACGSVVGLGSDVAGSIRFPCLYNGIYGHKTTQGAVSIHHYKRIEGKYYKNYICFGPMCRYASDLLPMMKVLSNNNPVLKLGQDVDFRKLKIYYALDDGKDSLSTYVMPEIKDAIKRAVQHFGKTYNSQVHVLQLDGLRYGLKMWTHKIAEEDVPPYRVAFGGGKGPINLYWEFIKCCLRVSNHTLPGLFMCLFQSLCPGKGSKERKEILKLFDELQEQIYSILDEDSVFFYPTQPEYAPHHHDTYLKFHNLNYTGFTNVLKLPSTSVPLGLCNGLPIGFQIMAGKNQDNLTISVAVELEKAFGGWIAPCPVL